MYQMSVRALGRLADPAAFDKIILKTGTDGNLEPAINLAMEDILGPHAHDLKLLIKANFRPSWAVMSTGRRFPRAATGSSRRRAA